MFCFLVVLGASFVLVSVDDVGSPVKVEGNCVVVSNSKEVVGSPEV